MKKFFALFVCCCCAAVFADDIEIKNIINRSKIGATTLRDWGLNNRNHKDIGSGVVIQGSEKDEKAFKMTAGKITTFFYMYNPIKVKAGDKVKISADIKGKGTFVTGFYTYTSDNKHFAAKNNIKRIKLTDKMQEVECKFVVPNGNKGEIIGLIRPCVAADPMSEVIIEDLEIEVDHQDR